MRDAVKRFGAVTALAGVSLTIRDNEFFTLLGPSGCGKTTLLRLIAGFEEITEGEILLYGEDIGTLPPNRRPINTVFQHYALFPHMTVAENVAFGMRRLGWSKADIEDQTVRILDLVKLGDLAARRPAQLSGGQQQRVALARAMAPRPKVLLLDEPLSALDLKLRQAMRIELKQIQEETGITFVFVTHDQEEALTMSDRIAVMSAGEIRQVGTPHEIYEAPVDRFVADFIGETNVLDVTVQRGPDGAWYSRLPNGAAFPCQAAGTPPDGRRRRARADPPGAPLPRARGGVRHAASPAWSTRPSTSAPTFSTASGWTRGRTSWCARRMWRRRGALSHRRPGRARHRPRRRPAPGGLMAGELASTRAVSRTFAPVRTPLLIPTWVIIGFFLVAPVLMMLAYSFLTKEFRGGVIWEFSLAAYDQFIFDRGLFGDEAPQIEWTYIVIFVRSIIQAAVATLLCLIIGFPTAYFIATRSPATRSMWLFLVTVPYWVNLLIRTVSMKFLIRDNGPLNEALMGLGVISEPIALINTDFAVQLGLFYSYLPFMVLPIYASVERYDFALSEAAADLYANRWTILRRVILPIVRPGIVAGCILVFVPSLGAFLAPDLLGGAKNFLIGSLIEEQFKGNAGNWPFGAAASMILLSLVLIALFIYARRQALRSAKQA